MKNSFLKTERLCSRTAIERLFANPSHVITVWPCRIILRTDSYVGDATSTPLPQILISVPKKRFHHATDRNRVKRLVREAYRMNKQPLITICNTHRLAISMAIVCLTDNLPNSSVITHSIQQGIYRIARQLSSE